MSVFYSHVIDSVGVRTSSSAVLSRGRSITEALGASVGAPLTRSTSDSNLSGSLDKLKSK